MLFILGLLSYEAQAAGRPVAIHDGVSILLSLHQFLRHATAWARGYKTFFMLNSVKISSAAISLQLSMKF